MPRFLPFKMDSLCFFRFETLEEVDEKCYFRIKLEDELVLISLANRLKKYVFTHNVFLEQSFACQTDKKARYFLAEIRNWSNLKVLFVIDFSKFSKILCRKELVDKIIL